MGFIVEVELTKRDLKRVSTKAIDCYEWNESCGEDIFVGTREVKTVDIGGLGFFVHGDKTLSHCSHGGTLYGEILRAIGTRRHYVDGVLAEEVLCQKW